MKKASKLLWALLSLAMAAFMLGCPTNVDDEDDGYQNPTQITSEWQTFYIKMVDSNRPVGTQDLTGLEAFHMHGNSLTDVTVGLEIQKIFVSNTKSAEVPRDATMIVDFSADTITELIGNGLYWENFSGAGDPRVTPNPNVTLANGVAKINDIALQANPDSDLDKDIYFAGLGTNKIAAAAPVYWGFVLRNTSETANPALIDMDATGSTMKGKGDIVGQMTPRLFLSEWFGLDGAVPEKPADPEKPAKAGVVVQDWTTVYFHMEEAGAQVLGLWGGEGSVEIQKIFLNTTAAETGTELVTLFDFTQETAYDGTNFWWGADSMGNVVDGSYVMDGNAGGRWGSPKLGTANQYIGFTIKSADGLGNTRFMLQKAGDADYATVRFDSILPDIVEDWTTVYYLIEKDAKPTIFKIAGDIGSVEIEKIFLNDAEADDASSTVIFDFTADPKYVDGNFWWGQASLNSYSEAGYLYEGVNGCRFGSPKLSKEDSGGESLAQYIGLKIKSTFLGNTNFVISNEPTTGNVVDIATVPFNTLLPTE